MEWLIALAMSLWCVTTTGWLWMALHDVDPPNRAAVLREFGRMLVELIKEFGKMLRRLIRWSEDD